MTSRSTLRPPPRWSRPRRPSQRGLITASQASAVGRPARSIAVALCIVAVMLSLGASPAGAYPCGEPRPSRTLSVVAKEECPRPVAATRPRRQADFASLAVFVGMLALVLVVPVRYSRRRFDDPE